MTTEIDWNADWSATRAHWPAMFDELGLVGKPGLQFMEIGCFEGQSALWTLENVLTHPSSQLLIIDPVEFRDINDEDQHVRLERHLGRFFANDQAHLIPMRSEDALRGWDNNEFQPEAVREFFDFVYIDGDHYPRGVIKDAVLTWPHVKPGGHVLYDDYVYELGGHAGPRAAIDAFVLWYEHEIAWHGLVGEDQYLVRKATS